MNSGFIKLIEHNDIIHTVQELWSKCFIQRFLDHATGEILIRLTSHLGIETNATAEIFQLPGTNIGSHDQDRILEINTSTQTIRQTAFIQDLQQQVKYIRMRLLDLVQ